MSPRIEAKGGHISGLNSVPRALIAAVSISLVVFLYDRALVPLYGSGPTTYLLQEIVLATIAVAEFIPSSSSPNWICLPALCLSLAPNATYWVAVTTSRRGNPIQGTLITHLAVLAPLILSLTTLAFKSNVSVLVYACLALTGFNQGDSTQPHWVRWLVYLFGPDVRVTYRSRSGAASNALGKSVLSQQRF